MNKYSKHQFVRFYQLFKARAFDQDDVAFFLVTARDYSSAQGVFRELGDFLAHPKEKDRGIVFGQVTKIAPLYEEYLRRDHNVPPSRVDDPPFDGLSRKDIAQELHGLFLQAGLESEPIGENAPEFRDFLFCLIFLLAPFQLNVGGNSRSFQVEYGHSIKLSVLYESSFRPRNFVVLSVLFLPNVNLRWTLDGSRKLFGFIARRHKLGCLAAISFENDLAEGFLNRDDLNANYRQPEAWFLPDPH